jgi:hypothetical protein
MENVLKYVRCGEKLRPPWVIFVPSGAITPWAICRRVVANPRYPLPPARSAAAASNLHAWPGRTGKLRRSVHSFHYYTPGTG